jgi:O-antigen/teichoic acid export membrane protein
MSRAESAAMTQAVSMLKSVAATPHFSVALRALALAVKFAAVFFMAKLLSPVDFGTYGLLAAGVGYATYLVGADYYTFSNRELIRSPSSRRGAILKNQGAASVVTYVATLPLVAAAFACGLLPLSLFCWFLALLVVEHVAQESTRLLVALGHPSVAAQVLFIRIGLWPLVVVPLLWRWPALRELRLILVGWVGSVVLSVVLAALVMARSRMEGWREPLDWSWIRRGFRVAAVFFVGSLALRGLFAIDRFWMGTFSMPEVLGAYVFYMAIAGALPALLVAGVFTFEYPSMIATYPTIGPGDRRTHARSLLLRVAMISVAYAGVIAISLPIALRFVGKPEYAKHVFFMVAGLASMILYVLSLVPHFALYALGRDRGIAIANVLSFLLFVPVVLALKGVLSAYDAIPAGLCVAFAVLLAWKWIAFSRLSPSFAQPG